MCVKFFWVDGSGGRTPKCPKKHKFCQKVDELFRMLSSNDEDRKVAQNSAVKSF